MWSKLFGLFDIEEFHFSGEKTAIYCLTQHDWKLDIALDNYFANPEVKYLTESKPKIILFCFMHAQHK